MGNVWQPNIIKHCLVTKHADVEVSGQTVKTCLIKHRSNYGYKLLSNRGTHACAKHVWYGCPNEQNIAHQTWEQKKCFKLFDRMFDGLQVLSNTTKHDQTRSNSAKQGGQMVKCLVTKQCLMVFGRQTFPVWTGLNMITDDSKKLKMIIRCGEWVLSIGPGARLSSGELPSVNMFS